jgi:hypothetical protein
MRDLTRMIDRIERAFTQNLDAPAPRPRASSPPKSPTSWRAPDARPSINIKGETQVNMQERSAAIAVKSIKVMIGLDPEAVKSLKAQDGLDRVSFTVTCDSDALRTSITTKSLNKAKKTIREHGAANVGSS